MNILDENINDSQRQQLKNWRIAIRQIGYDLGTQGMKDHEIIPFLLQQPRSTFFTRDDDFYLRRLCHAKYCLVYLEVKKEEAAFFIRRFLRQKEFDSSAKRMGNIIWVSHTGLLVWQLHAEREIRFGWS